MSILERSEPLFLVLKGNGILTFWLVSAGGVDADGSACSGSTPIASSSSPSSRDDVALRFAWMFNAARDAPSPASLGTAFVEELEELRCRVLVQSMRELDDRRRGLDVLENDLLALKVHKLRPLYKAGEIALQLEVLAFCTQHHNCIFEPCKGEMTHQCRNSLGEPRRAGSSVSWTC